MLDRGELLLSHFCCENEVWVAVPRLLLGLEEPGSVWLTTCPKMSLNGLKLAKLWPFPRGMFGAHFEGRKPIFWDGSLDRGLNRHRVDEMLSLPIF